MHDAALHSAARDSFLFWLCSYPGILVSPRVVLDLLSLLLSMSSFPATLGCILSTKLYGAFLSSQDALTLPSQSDD